jgi:predicted PolB exonuclease-like 3'-5' exonuclease
MLPRVIRLLLPRLFAFDLEWIPDPQAAARLFGVSADCPQGREDAFRRLWQHGGATAEQPRPFLKLTLCRIVSLCGIYREQDREGKVSLKLVSLPADPGDSAQAAEASILRGFHRSMSERRPQLIGFNSQRSDLPIIVNRSVVHGLSSHGWALRPEKPWEGSDYFASHGDHHVDLGVLLGWGGQMPTLHEIASCSGIPGKLDVCGSSVADLWLRGDLAGIVAYNEFDAFTTFLLWARMAHFSSLLSDQAYVEECERVEALLIREGESGRPHLLRYLEYWRRMRF